MGDKYVKESDASAEEISNKKLGLGIFDIWALGITIVIGGQYFSWNAGYASGFGSYLISTILIGTSYICLCFCNAEISSALPFAGGAYGLARVSLGMYPGFIVGCLEAGEYILYVAQSAISLSLMIIQITNTSSEMLPVYCLIFYLSALVIHIAGGTVFWRSNAVFALLSIGFLFIFILGSIPWCDFNSNALSRNVTGADRNEYFVGGFSRFLQSTPLAAWFYVGVESLNLAAAFVQKPRETIGYASIACVLTLFATSIAVLFVCASLPRIPSADDIISLAADLNPLNDGFIRMFRASANMVTILSLPATYATAFGFIFAYGRVITAMAKSSLFPAIFTKTYGHYETPYVAFIVGSVMGYALCILAYFDPRVTIYLFNICILSGFIAYISQFVGFILFRIRHATQERLFVSPLGIPGAVYGILVFSLSSVSVIGFQEDDNIAVITLLIGTLIYTIYYFSYAKMRQRFSPEEKFIFVLQIVKFNERARLLATRGTLMKKPAAFRGLMESRNKSSSYGGHSTKHTPSAKNSIDTSSAILQSGGTASTKDSNHVPKQNILQQGLLSMQMKSPKIHIGDIESGLKDRSALYSVPTTAECSIKVNDSCPSPLDADREMEDKPNLNLNFD